MDVGIQKIHEKCPRLQELSVANCSKLTDAAFTVIGQVVKTKLLTFALDARLLEQHFNVSFIVTTQKKKITLLLLRLYNSRVVMLRTSDRLPTFSYECLKVL